MTQKGFIGTIVLIILGIVIFLALGYMFIATPNKITGSDKVVAPFHLGETVLSERVTYLFKKPEVGDRVTFTPQDRDFLFVGIVTEVKHTENTFSYSIVSANQTRPWIVSQDRIRSKIYYPFIDQTVVTNLALSLLPTPTPTVNPDYLSVSLENLPKDVLSAQIDATYSINGKLYALAIENNFNYFTQGLDRKNIQWHGVLRTDNNGQTWNKLFTIVDPKDPGQIKSQSDSKISFNPVGVFFENQKLYIDIADARGAGSGEGNLLRFSSVDDGKTWQREQCYYFNPYTYYKNFNNGINGKADMSEINPHNVTQSNSCIY